MASLLEIRDLEVHFGVTRAVRGVHLHLEAGEVVGLVGESGSGARRSSAPQHLYTQSLLDAVPTLRTDRGRPLAMVSAAD